MDNADGINLLWTGGFDSTFRLCQIAIVLKKKVQPYYLIDPNRLSLREEIQAQERIKQAIFDRYPTSKELILPTAFYTVSDEFIDDEIAEVYGKVKELIGFGSQYEWLAGFCKSHGINNLELGFEKDSENKKNKFLMPFILQKENQDGEKSFIMNSKFKGDPTYELFKYYEWPIWMITRDDMVDISKQYNFHDIMHLTWFCHTPIKGKACGLCNPCKDVVGYNFKYRLSAPAKLRFHLRSFSQNEIMTNNPKLKKLMKSLKRN